MKNDVIITGIFFVAMVMPLHESPVDFDVAAICNIANANDSLGEIRPPAGVQRSSGENPHAAAVGGPESRVLDELPAPDMAEKSFVEYASTHTIEGNSAEVRTERPAGSGRTGNYEKNCFR
jgi:hypothetical protein